MPLVPDHSASLRQPAAAPAELPVGDDIVVHLPDDDEGADHEVRDDKGNVIRIEHANGDVTVSVDGKPISEAEGEAAKPAKWFDNLIDRLPAGEDSRITEELMRRIADDIESRKEWIEDRAIGLKLLGTKIELPQSSAADSAPVEGMNRVRHPLLLEAVLRFQANARGEMLPSDGPVKIRNDSNNPTLSSDDLANALERDMNHYLTATATEYYPDTDRMFLMLGFGGTTFKKVYSCPLRNRPVSETVDADDLIVNSSCTDLGNAKRITHRTMVKPSTIKRLQILGVYKNVELNDPVTPTLDAVQQQKKDMDGVTSGPMLADDRDREIYEVLCELDVKGFEHKFNGKETGLEIPYRVTIDVSSRTMLAIVRNYDKETEKLPVARRVYVKYTFVPGFGFYDIGLLNILGNTTNAITAAWRELLDAGMFANFPGFLLSDTGARQNTNIFRVPPGGAALVRTGGQKISEAVMQLPYKEPSMALMTLTDKMAETGARVGGTAELQVAEGKQEAPVGTTLAMIEQAQKILNSVHKRVHQAQSEEFELLVECFREHPESFWQRNRRPAMPWDEATFRKALEAYDLVPRADPNTASYLQRALKVMGIKQLQQASPSLYDPLKVDKAVLRTMGWSNPDEFFASPDAQAKPPPELLEAQAKAKVSQQDADSRAKVADAKAQEIQAKIQSGAYAPEQQDAGLGKANMLKAQAAMMDAETRRSEMPFRAHELAVKHADMTSEDQNRDQDRSSRERVALLGLAKDIIVHGSKIDHEADAKDQDQKHERVTQQADHAHERQMQREAPKPKAPAK